MVSAPSGAGKSTLCQALRGLMPGVRYSVSATTRPSRSGEQDGRDYFFLSREKFLKLAQGGKLVERARVHGHWYGTPKAAFDAARRDGADLFLDLDIQGAKSVKRLYPDAVLVFIAPPSMRALEDRLRTRSQDSEAVIRRRLANVWLEVKAFSINDYLIVNDKLSEALDQLRSILVAERRRVGRVRFERRRVNT